MAEKQTAHIALERELLLALQNIRSLAAYMNSSGNGIQGTLARIGYLAEAAIHKADQEKP